MRWAAPLLAGLVVLALALALWLGADGARRAATVEEALGASEAQSVGSEAASTLATPPRGDVTLEVLVVTTRDSPVEGATVRVGHEWGGVTAQTDAGGRALVRIPADKVAAHPRALVRAEKDRYTPRQLVAEPPAVRLVLRDDRALRVLDARGGEILDYVVEGRGGVLARGPGPTPGLHCFQTSRGVVHAPGYVSLPLNAGAAIEPSPEAVVHLVPRDGIPHVEVEVGDVPGGMAYFSVFFRGEGASLRSAAAALTAGWRHVYRDLPALSAPGQAFLYPDTSTPALVRAPGILRLYGVGRVALRAWALDRAPVDREFEIAPGSPDRVRVSFDTAQPWPRKPIRLAFREPLDGVWGRIDAPFRVELPAITSDEFEVPLPPGEESYEICFFWGQHGRIAEAEFDDPSLPLDIRIEARELSVRILDAATGRPADPKEIDEVRTDSTRARWDEMRGCYVLRVLHGEVQELSVTTKSGARVQAMLDPKAEGPMFDVPVDLH